MKLYLGNLPDHIVTVPTLHQFYSRLIVTTLLLVWKFAVLLRFRPLRLRTHWLVALSSISMVLLSVWLDQLGTCMLGPTAHLALFGFPFDALAMLGVLALASRGWTMTAIGLTIAYATSAWTSVTVPRLPDYDNFLANLRPAPSIYTSVQEDRCSGCTPMQLPCHCCHSYHHACMISLSRLYEADEGACPVCLRSLFIYQSWRTRIRLLYLLLTSTTAAYVLSSFPL
jgi:hypothetical protein